MASLSNSTSTGPVGVPRFRLPTRRRPPKPPYTEGNEAIHELSKHWHPIRRADRVDAVGQRLQPDTGIQGLESLARHLPMVRRSTCVERRSRPHDQCLQSRRFTMSTENAAQIAEWNGAQGQRWAELQREIDGIVVPFGDAALNLAAPQAGERVIDVGCGCGDTSIELARAVGETGSVLGIDVSRPMLEVARSRAGLAGLGRLAFREADASDAELPAQSDLLFSRFGVMFFGEPVPAFGHLRESMRSHGRCVFACWRAPRDNSWA